MKEPSGFYVDENNIKASNESIRFTCEINKGSNQKTSHHGLLLLELF